MDFDPAAERELSDDVCRELANVLLRFLDSSDGNWSMVEIRETPARFLMMIDDTVEILGDEADTIHRVTQRTHGRMYD